MVKLNKFIVTSLVALTAMSVQAAERQFSYPAAGSEVLWFGNAKVETFDVAIRIDDPAMVGKQITGVSVAVPQGADLKSPSAWLTTELKLKSKKNDPDVASVEATINGDRLTATFDEPYTITAAGIYVGYSVTAASVKDEASQYPIAVSYCSTPGSMYLHSSRTDLKWFDFNAQQGGGSDLTVTLDGDFPDYAVGVASASDLRTTADVESAEVSVILSNLSVEPVNSIDYTVTFGDGNGVTNSLELAEPIAAKFGTKAAVQHPVPVQKETTTYTVAVDRVNGHDNALASTGTATANYIVMAFVPVNRPLMEEYTGLWCGWCPRGLVAMEEMSRLYGSDFVCISYHCDDEMQYMSEFPNDASGYPSAFMNRQYDIDPWYGKAKDGFGLRDFWLELRETTVIADLDVELTWQDDSHKVLNCSSYVRFVQDVNGDDYRVNYVITCDDYKTRLVFNDDGSLNDDESIILNQSSFYNGAEPLSDSPLWDQIVNGGSNLIGLTFNDVAVANDNLRGVKALPSQVKANATYSNVYQYDFGQILDHITENELVPVADITKLRCVAVLLTADGSYVNCNRSEYVGTAGNTAITADRQGVIVSTEWYDLQGRRVINPQSGLYIRVDRLSDGTTLRNKTLR